MVLFYLIFFLRRFLLFFFYAESALDKVSERTQRVWVFWDGREEQKSDAVTRQE